MKRIFISLLFLVAFFSTSSAQLEYGGINPNQINIRLISDGRLFTDGSVWIPRFQVPYSPGITPYKSTISLGSLWFMAIDTLTGDTLMAIQTYGNEGNDFIPGPLPPGAGIGFNPPDVHLSKFKRDEIETGRDDSSKLVAGVKNWPAFYEYNGQTYSLAPFHDVNNNGQYEPHLGDYPKYNGEEYIYFVYHDMVNHSISKTEPIGLQIEVEAFGFRRLYTDYDDILFLRYRVVNMNRNLREFRMGVFTDFDLGNYEDDYIATDTGRNMVYVYNGDNDDEFINGYGFNPPVTGIVFLNQPLCHTCVHNTVPRWKDSTNAFRPPYYPREYKNLMEGKSSSGDSVLVSFPGSGSNLYSTYAFNGDPAKNKGWTMENDTFSPRDYRSLAVTGQPTLNQSDTFELFLMYVYDRAATNGGRLASIDSMRSKIDMLRYYNFIPEKPQIPANCFEPQIKEDTTGPGIGFEMPAFKKPLAEIYPNPASKTLQVHNNTAGENLDYTLFNASGQVISFGQASLNFSIDVNELPNGLYFLKLNNPSQHRQETFKFIIQH